MPQKNEMKWHSPRALAERADDGLLVIVRSTGKAMGGLSSGPMKGISKVGQVLTRREKKTVEPQTKTPSAVTSSAVPPRQLDEETKPAEPRYPHALPDLDTLLKERSPQGAAQAVVLRKCLDDLVLGSEKAGEEALKILVDMGQVAEPLLVACLPTDSPRVAKIALEGLNRIGSQRLFDCISDVLESADPELRFVALRAAVGLRDYAQQRLLLERGLRDSNSEVRRCSLSYVAWHESYWAIGETMRLCNDKMPDVQWAAVETLMALRPSEVSRILPLVKPSLAPVNQRRLADLLAQQEDQGVLSDKNEKRMRNASKAG